MCHRCASIKLSWAISAFSCFGLFCCLEWEKTVCVRYIGKGLDMYSSSPVLCWDLIGLYIFFTGCQHMSNLSAPHGNQGLILTTE